MNIIAFTAATSPEMAKRTHPFTPNDEVIDNLILEGTNLINSTAEVSDTLRGRILPAKVAKDQVELKAIYDVIIIPLSYIVLAEPPSHPLQIVVTVLSC
jgi:hypothetical protein